jgi:hypothetical protein
VTSAVKPRKPNIFPRESFSFSFFSLTCYEESTELGHVQSSVGLLRKQRDFCFIQNITRGECRSPNLTLYNLVHDVREVIPLHQGMEKTSKEYFARDYGKAP